MTQHVNPNKVGERQMVREQSGGGGEREEEGLSDRPWTWF